MGTYVWGMPRGYISKSAVGSPAVRRFEPQDEISRPTEWPVVRLDNVRRLLFLIMTEILG